VVSSHLKGKRHTVKPIENDFEKDKGCTAPKQCRHGNTLPPWGLGCRACALERSKVGHVPNIPSVPPVPIKKADVEEEFLYMVAALQSFKDVCISSSLGKVDFSLGDSCPPYFLPVFETYEEALQAGGDKNLIMKIRRKG